MSNKSQRTISEGNEEISLNRDNFMRDLIGELAGSLEDIVGLDNASGYISLVGQAIGEKINKQYCDALLVDSLNRQQVTEVLIDLKRRIKGKFYVIEESEDKIVLGNHACPFGDKVLGHSSMCMMTSNVFGYIAAENLGYAKVELQETIAEGHKGCLVVIHLKNNNETNSVVGREYVGN